MSTDYFISIGNDCAPALAFEELKIKKATLPFDWVPSTIGIVYDFLQNPEKFAELGTGEEAKQYPELQHFSTTESIIHTKRRNRYGVWFPHDIKKSDQELVEQIKRRTERFFAVLKNSKKVVFVYSNEHALYLKCFRDKQVEFYEYLLKIEKWVEENYPDLEFKIVALHINHDFANTKHIINHGIRYPEKCIIDNAKFKENYETFFRKSVEMNIRLYTKS